VTNRQILANIDTGRVAVIRTAENLNLEKSSLLVPVLTRGLGKSLSAIRLNILIFDLYLFNDGVDASLLAVEVTRIRDL
jgi:hypothetical protein